MSFFISIFMQPITDRVSQCCRYSLAAFATIDLRLGKALNAAIKVPSAVLLLLLLNACHSNGNDDSVKALADKAAAETLFVQSLLDRMTLEEKVGQMVQAEIKHVTPNEVREYGLGSVLNGGGSHPNNDKYASINDWRQLADQYYQASKADPSKRAAIPLLWGTDSVHGHNNLFGAVIFPHNINLGAANNPALTRKIFAATAIDVTQSGINWAFAPTVAVARDDRWGRTYESFSEDPRIVSMLATEAVLGLQGDSPKQLKDDDRVVATAKHFIGDGGTYNGVDQGDTQGDQQQLMDIHGQSFIAALNADAQTVMASFNSWNGEKLHGHDYALNDLLKEQMGFDGFVVGDWNAHAQIDGCTKGNCAQAFNAGVDMLMAPEDWKALIYNTVEQVKSGEISLARIDDAVSRILSVKYRAGLFDKDNRSKRFSDQQLNVQLQNNKALARQAVRESLVLLKNNDQLLPLRADSRILVIGEAANKIAHQTGGWTLTWQGDGNSNADFPNGSSLLAAFETAVAASSSTDGKTINTGSVTYDPQGELAKSASVKDDFDSVIFVFGEEPYAEGVGDLNEVRPPNRAYKQLEILQALAEQGIPVTSILLTGRPLSTNAFINASKAFVVAWLPGTEGDGIADVIIGDSHAKPRYDFSGKLAFSWPRSSEQTNINNYPQYQESPQFEVGYGLTYGSDQQLAMLENSDKLSQRSLAIHGSLPIFLKKINDPWTLYVGDEDNWSVSIDGNGGSTANKTTVVVSASDNATQEDARKIEWTDNKYGQIYFQHNQALDISELAQNDAALQFKVKVQTPPNDTVALRMDCRYPCSGQVDVTQLLKSLPMNSWQHVAIDLNCFSNSGAELSKIDTPFLMGTSGELTLEISHIVIEPMPVTAKRIDCSNSITSAN